MRAIMHGHVAKVDNFHTRGAWLYWPHQTTGTRPFPSNLASRATARSRKMNSALNGGIGTIIMNVFVGVLVLETVIYSIASI